MPLVNPHLFPSEWNYVRIGGQVVPLLCIVSEAKKHNTWDVKRGKGSKGAQYSYTGLEPAHFTITFRLWQTPGVTSPVGGQDDFAVWDSIVSLLQYDPTKQTITAVEIYHPSLVSSNITSVITEDIGNVLPVDPENPNGEYRVTVGFIDYTPAPPQNVTGNPNGSAGGLPHPPVEGQNQPTDQQLLQQLEAEGQSPT